jgi:hypothetical protein
VRATIDEANRAARRKTQTSNMAASYDNRCYAYMQLGELKRALDESNASLKYASLPGAVREQQS